MATVRGAVQTLLVSATQSASGTKVLNPGTLLGGDPDSATFVLSLTASSSPTTLDVYLQTSLDGGTTWIDFVHFSQFGAISTGVQIAQWTRIAYSATNGTSVVANGDAVLGSAKVVQGPIVGSQVRVKWVIAGTSYTFSVLGILDRN